MASSKETYCLCGQPYNVGQFMIECDCCREWFHGSCVDVKVYQSDDIDKYHCPKCAQTYGSSVLKVPTNNHRSDRYELGAESRQAQIGSPAWVRALAARPLRPIPAALQRMRGFQFTEELVRDNGFTRPVLFHSAEGLDIKTPNPGTFTVRSVLRYCGAQLEVEVIDVRKQSTLRMPLGEFVDYFETPPEARDDKVLNVISLEFSDTNMSPLVEPPLVARKLDWSERVWVSAEARPPRPAVQKYCLMSAQGAYTDWHVDFGGTTVWYHVVHGRKIFYFAPPTATNLALYKQWNNSSNNERFLGDLVEWYGSSEVLAGETLFIPSGWLHAVLTPCDSLVFGGNLLHSFAIEMQLQIYEIERSVETPMVYRYPLFEPMHWYAGAHLLTMLRRHNEETQDEDFILSESDIQCAPAPLPALLLRGIKILSNALKEWHTLKSTDTAKRDNVPKCLNSGQLVRELCKELRTLEKRSTTSTGKDKDFKIKNSASPTKAPAKKAYSTQKKSLKLTLPKPIMHMSHNGEYIEEPLPKDLIYTEKTYIDNKDVLYQDPRYITQDIKYAANSLQEAKTLYVDGKEIVLPDKGFIYQNYEEPLPNYVQEMNGYVERQEKKNGESVLRIKLNNSPSSSRDAPPPYTIPSHSILKSHLLSRTLPPEHLPPQPPLKPIQQWTISKKDIGEYQEEQILFTNENFVSHPASVPAPDMGYGPGMYSTDDIQQDYSYTPVTKSYPEYGYQHVMPEGTIPQPAQIVDAVRQRQQIPPVYNNIPVEDTLNGGYHQEQLPSYDAAIAQQYANNSFIIEEPLVKPTLQASPTPVRRSERACRRRLSNTYDYEDGDLYLDDAAPPRRAKHERKLSNGNRSNYNRQANSRPAPTNGIESLIQASVLAEEPPSATEDAAVAGMLSIAERFTAPQRTFGLASDVASPSSSQQDSAATPNSKRQRKPAVLSSADEEQFADEADVIKEVHRDEEYVYPSLEMSSDEDEDWTATRRRQNSRNKSENRAKSEKDESWSPRARLGRLVPRVRAPSRANVRRECVRAALTAAASRDAVKETQLVAQNAKRAVLATKSRRPPPPAQPSPKNQNSRLKKGMKTAKQRLGKILKIHKMKY